MSLNTILADVMRERAVTLARVDAGVRAKVLSLLRQLERDLVRKIAELDGFGELTAARRASLEATIQWARNTISQSFKTLDGKVVEQLRDLSRIEGKFVERSFNGSVNVQVLDVGLTAQALESIVQSPMVRGVPSSEWWASQSVTTARRFAQEMRLGMVAGENVGQLIQRVRGTSENGFADGIMQTTRREAEALVRTSVQSVANQTRLEIYKQNSDVIGALQHVSTLDDRTTDICKVRDGLRWTLDGEPIGHDLPFETPPLHWNCRSTLVPVTRTWREMGFNVGELTPGQRASLDGQVPDDMTYETWLRGKGEDFQNRVLGEGRAELWRGGHISFRELVDQRGRPLTLQQIEESF